MESEIVDEIPDCSVTTLHLDETENVLNTKDELLNGKCCDKTMLTVSQLSEARGQVVPSNGCLVVNLESKDSESDDHLAVPRGSFPPIDSLKESEDVSKQTKIDLDEDSKETQEFTSTESASFESTWPSKFINSLPI